MKEKNFEAMEKEAEIHEKKAALTRTVAKALDKAGFTFMGIKISQDGFCKGDLVIELKKAALKEETDDLLS